MAYNQYKDEEALALFEEGYQLNQKYQAGFCVDFCINLAKVIPILEAEEYLKKGLKCASSIGDTIAVQIQFGNLYTREKQYEKAIVFYTNNQQIAQNIKDTLAESDAYQYIGGVYLIEGKWKQATDSYLKSITLKEKIKDQQGLVDAHHNLAMVYFSQNQYETSLAYYQKCEHYYSNNKDTAELLEIWSNKASVYIAQAKYDTATTLLNQVLSLLEQFPNPTVALKSQMNLADIYLKKENYPKALALFEASLEAAQGQEDYFNLLTIYNFMGVVHRALQDYEQSIFYNNKALTLSRKLNILDEQHLALFGLYKSYEAQGNSSQALDWYKQYIVIKDSLYNVENTTKIANMLEQYDNLLKANEIKQLKLEKQTTALAHASQTTQLYGVLVVVVLVLALVLLLWAYRHQQQQALQHKQKIKELITEQEIKVLEASVAVQSKEREKLGHDIHDTIGTALAMLHFQHLVGNELADNEAAFMENYQAIAELIEHANNEMHAIASQMDKGEQAVFEIRTAIEQLAERIQATKQFDLVLKFDHKISNLPRHVALALYRVLKEALVNSLKHARAKKVMVEIIQVRGRLLVTIKDDGRGFDTQTAKDGMGLRTMRDRVMASGGQIKIKSAPQSGTKIIVNIPMINSFSTTY